MAKRVTKKTAAKKAPAAKKTTAKTTAKTSTAKKGVDSKWREKMQKYHGKWAEAQKTQDGMTPPDIDNGSYFARCVGATHGFTSTDDIPWTRFAFVVMSGDYEGTQLQKFIRLVNPKDKTTLGMEHLVKTARHLGFQGVNEMDLGEVPELCEAITEDQPFCQIAVKNTYKDDRHYQEIYVNKLLDEEGNVITE